jgi:glycosyltransferase involved in cell wall biosynthesis
MTGTVGAGAADARPAVVYRVAVRGGATTDDQSARPIDRAGRYGRAGARWARLVLPRRRRHGAHVFYGHDRVPAPGDPVRGGTAKFQRLAERFPNEPTGFTILYLGSTWLPRDLRPLLRLARRREVPVVLNQDGVGYPAWAGDRTDAVNRPLRRALAAADHVLYQSAFSKESADLFLGEPRGAWEVLPNAVDVGRFTPAREAPVGGPVVVLGGDQYQPYKLELGLRSFALVRDRHPEARLLVTGRLTAAPEELLRELALEDAVELVGRYAQRDAPELLRRAHVFLHPKVNDPCPSAVIEAMACGVPVVYAASGGTVELVGDDAGIGVEHPVGWERQQPPSPEALADAVDRVLVEHARFRVAARARAVERFPLARWLERHAEIFATLTGPEPRHGGRPGTP